MDPRERQVTDATRERTTTPTLKKKWKDFFFLGKIFLFLPLSPPTFPLSGAGARLARSDAEAHGTRCSSTSRALDTTPPPLSTRGGAY